MYQPCPLCFIHHIVSILTIIIKKKKKKVTSWHPLLKTIQMVFSIPENYIKNKQTNKNLYYGLLGPKELGPSLSLISHHSLGGSLGSIFTGFLQCLGLIKKLLTRCLVPANLSDWDIFFSKCLVNSFKSILYSNFTV